MATPVAEQQPAMSEIGFLNGGSPEKYEPFVNAFLQGLNETGYRQGQKRHDRISLGGRSVRSVPRDGC